MDHMRWIAALDSDPSIEGVLRFVRWLHDHTAGRHEVHGIHAVTEASAGFETQPAVVPERPVEQRRLRELLERHEVADAFTGVGARLGTPVAIVQELADEQPYDGVLVGRGASVEGFSGASLGRTARRLMRNLQLPVVVVPVSLREEELGRGSLVVGVTPSDDCLEAVRFAQRLAGSLSLSVVMVHAVRRDMPVASLGPLAVEPRDPGMVTSDIAPPLDTSRVEAVIDQWASRHDLHSVPIELRQGPAPSVLVDAARDHGATMIVCGARRLSRVERLFTSSVGADVAAHADRPVAVVPAR